MKERKEEREKRRSVDEGKEIREEILIERIETRKKRGRILNTTPCDRAGQAATTHRPASQEKLKTIIKSSGKHTKFSLSSPHRWDQDRCH